MDFSVVGFASSIWNSYAEYKVFNIMLSMKRIAFLANVSHSLGMLCIRIVDCYAANKKKFKLQIFYYDLWDG